MMTFLWLAGLALGCFGVGSASAQMEIFEAAKTGDIVRVEQLLESEHSALDYDVNGSTILHYAASGGQAKLAARLIARGADGKAANKDGFTPVQNGALSVNSETAVTLLGGGGILYARDNNEMTTLHLCGLSNNVDVAKILVGHGADVNDKTSTLWTPLRVAEYKSNKELIEWLRAQGAKE